MTQKKKVFSMSTPQLLHLSTKNNDLIDWKKWKQNKTNPKHLQHPHSTQDTLQVPVALFIHRHRENERRTLRPWKQWYPCKLLDLCGISFPLITIIVSYRYKEPTLSYTHGMHYPCNLISSSLNGAQLFECSC